MVLCPLLLGGLCVEVEGAGCYHAKNVPSRYVIICLGQKLLQICSLGAQGTTISLDKEPCKRDGLISL